MSPLIIIIFFFSFLAVLIAVAAFSQRKSVRISSAILAFGLACLMFVVARWAETLNYNIWYSSAASKMLKACIVGLEQGRDEVVLGEMKKMSEELDVTYEYQSNFRELAEQMIENLEMEPVVDSNTGPVISEIGTITDAGDLPFDNSTIHVSYEYDGVGKLVLSIKSVEMNAAAKGVIGSVDIQGTNILIRPRERYDEKGPVESTQSYAIQYIIQHIEPGRYLLNHDDSDTEGRDRETKLELDLTVAGKGEKTVKFEVQDTSNDPLAE